MTSGGVAPASYRGLMIWEPFGRQLAVEPARGGEVLQHEHRVRYRDVFEKARSCLERRQHIPDSRVVRGSVVCRQCVQCAGGCEREPVTLLELEGDLMRIVVAEQHQ